ncbi:MAG TPA: DNA/RNA non-specific endonuclease [Candidatus Mediterraneibacter stercoravium]|uniref:DNA/RNA non-specific endonuclease n=1 Tax=Candidatus Mediterraneibacter stercoravium TaxID=2838685 RepID=A0A9D2G838_9FIRM|nr:DNA/RNA non-specific endonuclease [Candidatus Mediterraneibacter stercoravium]
MRGKGEKRFRQTLLMLTTAFSLLLTACGTVSDYEYTDTGSADVQIREYESVADVPEYSGEPYVEINENQPEFTEEEITTEAFEAYSELDALGRCGEAEACIGEEIMPTEERGSISEVKPTGWKNEKYDNIDGEYLYNRCHLIGYQLSGENANAENLITGTRYMNTEGMLPFEDMVADYVHETENHVMYRVTPVFEGEDLVASGVQMEAESVEDDGKGVCFNVYVYNVQPDITIDYTTGDNWETTEEERNLNGQKEEQTYVLNKNTHKFHRPDCSGAADIKEKNREEFTGTREEVITRGYKPCTKCKP